MNKEQAAERAKAIAVVARNFPDAPSAEKLQDDLHRLGVKCWRNAEKLCSVEGYQDQREALRRDLDKIATRHGVTIRANLSGDPRGFGLYVLMPLGDFNTWGGAEHGYGFGSV